MPRFSSRSASSRRLTSGSVRETPAGTRSEPESHPPSLLCVNTSRDERKRKRAIRASPYFFLCAFLPPDPILLFREHPSLPPSRRTSAVALFISMSLKEASSETAKKKIVISPFAHRRYKRCKEDL